MRNTYVVGAVAVVAAAVVVVSAAACDRAIAPADAAVLSVDVKLDDRMLALDADAVATLRATVSVQGALGESELAIDGKSGEATGLFPVRPPGGKDQTLPARVRIYGAKNVGATEVQLGFATADVPLKVGATFVLNNVELVLTPDSTTPYLDSNKNTVDNLTELENGCDPAPPPPLVSLSTQQVSFLSGADVDVAQRQAFLVDDLADVPLTIEYDVVDAAGFGVHAVNDNDLFALTHDDADVQPGESLVTVASFTAALPALALGAIAVTATDETCHITRTDVVHLIGNADFPDDAEPLPEPAPLDENADLAGFPPENVAVYSTSALASGDAVTVTVSRKAPFKVFSAAAETAFLVEIPAGARLAGVMTDLPFDVDWTVLPLSAGDVANGTFGDPSRAGTSAEKIDFRPDDGASQRVLVLIGASGADDEFIDDDAPPAASLSPSQTQQALTSSQTSQALTARAPTSSRALAASGTVTVSLHVTRVPRVRPEGLPASGSLDGGTPIVLNGDGLIDERVDPPVPNVSVDVGGALATCTVNTNASNDAFLACLSPPGAAVGLVDIVVDAGADGRVVVAGGFVYAPDAPVVEDCQPRDIAVGGGTPVLITGRGFVDLLGLPHVTFNDVPAEDVQLLSDSAIFAVTPPLAAGAVDVTVGNVTGTIDGEDTIAATTLTAVVVTAHDPDGAAPSIASVAPAAGSTDGGTLVVITGGGFGTPSADGPTAVVRFGFVDGVVVNQTPTSITVTTPPSAQADDVDVTVIVDDGQHATADDAYGYVGAGCPGGPLCETCGNASVDGGSIEQCDGNDLDGASCASLGFTGGVLRCTASCTFDAHACAVCGNGILESGAGEVCDGANLGGDGSGAGALSCTTFGFTQGTMACAPSTCAPDASACFTPADGVCGLAESASTSPADCPVTCGDNTCDGTGALGAVETCSTCPRDCGTCAPYSATLVAGSDGQTAVVTGSLPIAVVVRIVDAGGAPVKNVAVLATPSAGALVDRATTPTTDEGTATFGMTLGPAVGQQTLTFTAVSPDGTPIGGMPLVAVATATALPPGFITTLINPGGLNTQLPGPGNGRPALATKLSQPAALTMDGNGHDVLIVDSGFRSIFRVRMPEGTTDLLGGAFNCFGPTGDGGDVSAACFGGFTDIAVDRSGGPFDGTIYITDLSAPLFGNIDNVRAIDTNGIIRHFAGGGPNAAPFGDGGPAASANFAVASGLAVGPDGDVYVVDGQRNHVRRIHVVDGTITTVTPTPLLANCGAIQGLRGPIKIDDDGNMYVATVINGNCGNDQSGLGVIEASAGGVGTTTTSQINFISGTGTDQGFDLYQGTAVGTRFIAGAEVRQIDLLGSSALVGGQVGAQGSTGDRGPATDALVAGRGAAIDQATGDFYFVESGFAKLRVIAGMQAADALAVDLAKTDGDAQTVPVDNELPRRLQVRVTNGGVPVPGRVVAFSTAERGVFIETPDAVTDLNGDATTAVWLGLTPGAVAIDARVKSFFGANAAPVTFNETASLPPSSRVVIGNENHRFGPPPLSGTALSQAAFQSRSESRAVVDPRDGTFLVANSGQCAIDRIDPDGVVTIFAGTGGCGFPESGDGGPAVSAHLSGPTGIAVDVVNDRVFIADFQGGRVRVVDSNGDIDTFAGGATDSFDHGDGNAPDNAFLASPFDVAVTPDGQRVYIADGGFCHVRFVENGVIGTWFGDPAGCNSGVAVSLRAVIADDNGDALIGCGALNVTPIGVSVVRAPAPGVASVVANISAGLGLVITTVTLDRARDRVLIATETSDDILAGSLSTGTVTTLTTPGVPYSRPSSIALLPSGDWLVYDCGGGNGRTLNFQVDPP